MQIEFLDKLDNFLRQEIGSEWNYTYTAEKDSLQIQLNVWIDPPTTLEHLKDVPKDKLETLKKIHAPKQFNIGETNGTTTKKND